MNKKKDETKELAQRLVQHFMTQKDKFNIPDKYFAEINNKLIQEEALQSYIDRYFSEILILRLKDKILVSHLYAHTKSSTSWRKLVPIYLREAEKIYVKGHGTAAIFFCRLTIETALRDKIIETKKKLHQENSISQEEKELSERTLNSLLKKACEKELAILKTEDINKIFSKLKRVKVPLLQRGENILNKFMHGDFLWMKDFLEKERALTDTYYDEHTKQLLVYPNTISRDLFIEILEATYKILLLLYPKQKMATDF